MTFDIQAADADRKAGEVGTSSTLHGVIALEDNFGNQISISFHNMSSNSSLFYHYVLHKLVMFPEPQERSDHYYEGVQNLLVARCARCQLPHVPVYQYLPKQLLRLPDGSDLVVTLHRLESAGTLIAHLSVTIEQHAAQNCYELEA